MELMPQDDVEKMYSRALDTLAAGNTQSALAQLERALKVMDNPALHSHLGYCIAKERGQVKKGRELCLAALEVEPGNPVHYLNLAKVHQIAGRKTEAIAALREGVALGGSSEIVGMLDALGSRKSPPLSFLSRDHLVNKWFGLLLSRLRLR